VYSDTFLTATVPSGAKTGFVGVTTPSGTLASNKKFHVAPQITSFDPTSGPVGTLVTITGVSLVQTRKIYFGGVQVTDATIYDTVVTANVPAGEQTGNIVIATAGGTAASATTFTVTP